MYNELTIEERKNNERCELCKYYRLENGKRMCIAKERCMMESELFSNEQRKNKVEIDKDCISCGGFKRK